MQDVFKLARGWLMAIIMFGLIAITVGLTFASVSGGHPLVAVAEGFAALCIFIAVCTAPYDSWAASATRWGSGVVSIVIAVVAIWTEGSYQDNSLWVCLLIGFSTLLTALGIVALISTRFRQIVEQGEELSAMRDQLQAEKGELQHQVERLRVQSGGQVSVDVALARLQKLETCVRGWKEEAMVISEKADHGKIDVAAHALRFAVQVRDTEI